MRRRRQVVYFALALFLTLAGCSGAKRSDPVWYDSTMKIHVGMTLSELQSVLGPSDRRYDMDFGGAIGQEWTGEVVEYDLDRNQAIRSVTAYHKARFVFYPSAISGTLNHWQFDSPLPSP